MDDEDYEERVLSILRGRNGWDTNYSSIDEFKEYLGEADLAEEEVKKGWVMWRANERYEQQHQLYHKILTLLQHINTRNIWFWSQTLVQFWGIVKEEGSLHYLSTSNYPFYIHRQPSKGAGWYRKICKDREAVEADQLGGVGRAYRNKRTESTPDLRLYSINEFPLRDEAARCGFTTYTALPIFDVYTQECYGVLEILSAMPFYLFALDEELQIAGLRSTHIRKKELARYQQHEKEISGILKAVPRLSLAQVWIPCDQCPNTSTTLHCTELISSKSNLYEYDDDDMVRYLEACKFHKLQIDLTCFHQNMSELSISQSPLAHYAKKARLSHCFSFCLQSVNNSNDPFVIVQFFLQLNNREDACEDSSLHLLLRIIETKLKSFQLIRIEHLPHKLVVRSRQSNITIECESIDMFNVMKSFKENRSELDFTTYLEASCSLPLFSKKIGDEGWVFCSAVNILNGPSLTEYKIEQFMKNIVDKLSKKKNCWIIQFWMPKKVEDRCHLETIDQPYAVSCLAKGLASFRKECTKHHYFVDDEAEEEELGPPGRVFRNEHPEFARRLSLYSTKEFGMRNYAVHCDLEVYFAIPVFDKQEHKCVGVLEFVGIMHEKWIARDIEEALKVAYLSTSSLEMHPRFKYDVMRADIARALDEVNNAFDLIRTIPQLYLAKVWVTYEKCATINSHVRYVELALTTAEYFLEMQSMKEFHWINVQPKKGMIGMVLESENKSCFCRNLSEFSIADQPHAVFDRNAWLDVCFAICLQSTHTGDLLYVLEFFLNPSINDLPSFFNFLLPIMKNEFGSFKYSSGKQLGEELVVEVIEFCEANNLASSELGQLDILPFKFKRVQYGQMENQGAEDESLHCVQMENQEAEEESLHCVQMENQEGEEESILKTKQGLRKTEQGLRKTNKGKRKINLHLSLEDLKPHFGKKLKDVEEELGVKRSTIKRACRKYGICRWPCNETQARNRSLVQREKAHDPSSSSSLQLQDASLHQNVAEKVMIKVKHEEDTIKFELCLSLGVSKLFEEVKKRLHLEIGGFKLKYMDEDDEEILIACDDDLQLCPKTQSATGATGRTCIQLFIPK